LTCLCRRRKTSRPTTMIGDTVSHYHILNKLCDGMGVVCEAEGILR